MEKLIIIGGGGHGKEVLCVIKEMGILDSFWGFVDDSEDIDSILGYKRIGSIDWLINKVDPKDVKLIIAIGNNVIRKEIATKLQQIGFMFFNAISPNSYISPFVRIDGSGIMIFPGVVINGDVEIKNHVIINVAASISHDSVIDNFANINPGSHLAGGIYVGEGAFVGMGANIIQYKKIGKWSVIGAGAVVVRDVPPRSLVVGVPARVVKFYEDKNKGGEK